MKWDDRIISDHEINRYVNDPATGDILERIDGLIAQQKRAWPLLREGYEGLAMVETKRMRIEGADVIIQHNPRRIRSTAARIDKASLADRRCFLCAENLPAEEKGISFDDKLIIFCNPYPICDGHLSIVHPQHIPQQIAGNIETLLDLAQALSRRYYVLYNGPESGASAPDHLHFQACPRRVLPIEDDLKSTDYQSSETLAKRVAVARDGFELLSLEGCGRSVIVFRGVNKDAITRWIYSTLRELQAVTGKDEPMVNIIFTCDERPDNYTWTVYLFPRARHRPAAFFEEGDRRLMVSPGSIDMAGLVIVPEHDHFLRIGPEDMSRIFSEVSLDADTVQSVIARVVMKAGEEEKG